ncbi:MAG TPA: hypothetical protein VGD27_09860 [Longimicrobiales bacterium]
MMSVDIPGSTIKLVLALALLGWMLWRGYTRRKGIWTARSWRRFAALLAGSIAIVVVDMLMAQGVDNGVYDRIPAFTHDAYFYTVMTLAVVGPLSFVAVMFWFANGRADRQLGFRK